VALSTPQTPYAWRSELMRTPGPTSDYWNTPITTGNVVWGIEGNAAGASYLSACLDPRDVNASFSITGKAGTVLSEPLRVGMGVTVSRRTFFQRGWIGLVGATQAGVVATTDDTRTLTGTGGIVVASSIATITTTAPHGLVVGSRVIVSGCADPRQNSYYTVTGIPTTTTFTFTPIVATAATYGTTTTITVVETGGAASDSFGIILKDATAANCDQTVRYGGGTCALVAWNPGGSWDVASAPTGYSGAYTYALTATKYLEFQHEGDWIGWGVWTADSSGAQTSTVSRDQGLPLPDAWVPRVQFSNQAHLPAPIGPITVASKSGSTTATLTVANHGLTTSDWISVFGIRDQTNFANSGVAQVASVIDANNITVIFGASATATSYGGVIFRAAANVAPTAYAPSSAIQSVTATSGRLTATFAATQGTWTVGETVCVVGLVDSTNTPQPTYEGLYRLARTDTTTFQVDLEPLQGQPLPGALTLGGIFVAAPAIRIHFARGRTSTDVGVTLESSKMTGRQASSVPVAFSGSTTLGTVTTVATVTSVSAVASSTPANSTAATLTAAATTNATSVKATGGNLYGALLTNYSAATKYFKLYNKASAPTVGTDVPVATIPIPATSAVPLEWGPLGLRLGTGIAFALTGAMADSDTTALAAGDVKVVLAYI